MFRLCVQKGLVFPTFLRIFSPRATHPMTLNTFQNLISVRCCVHAFHVLFYSPRISCAAAVVGRPAGDNSKKHTLTCFQSVAVRIFWRDSLPATRGWSCELAAKFTQKYAPRCLLWAAHGRISETLQRSPANPTNLSIYFDLSFL